MGWSEAPLIIEFCQEISLCRKNNLTQLNRDVSSLKALNALVLVITLFYQNRKADKHQYNPSLIVLALLSLEQDRRKKETNTHQQALNTNQLLKILKKANQYSIGEE